MQSVAIRRHQAVEQRTIHAMQILQSIDQRKLRPQIQLQSSMANRSKINQHHAPMRLLYRDGGVHSGGSSTGPTLGVQKSKDTRLARTALCPAQRRREARERFDQSLAAGIVIQKLARPR